jgi:benzoate-CoA ligase
MPHLDIPREYNAAQDLLSRNKKNAKKIAYINAATGDTLTFAELSEQAHRFASLLQTRGILPESRILVCMLDTPQWPVVFLGSILAGVIPVAANTLLTPKEFEYMLHDSRAKALIVSQNLLHNFNEMLTQESELKTVFVSDSNEDCPHPSLEKSIRESLPISEAYSSCKDDMCFWLYSSGSTGAPKGTVHLHSHLMMTAELYAKKILGIQSTDIVYSAAKLFFAYGLGNALTFPLSVGATTVLLPIRPTPQDVFEVLKKYQPTIFYGVPTLFASLLADETRPVKKELSLRMCTSAGEALPAEIGKKWTHEYGCEILDGIGSTEMLHIFLSNRPGEVRYGTTGKPVPGYELRIVNEEGQICADGELGELQIKGPSSALMYWNNREKTKATFAGEWTRSGDKYVKDADGYFTYGGRSDDMLKVGGIYVSPFEVEASIMTHPGVLEAAVVGICDTDELVKPKAFIVLKANVSLTETEIQTHVKSQLAPYKYPRWVEFVTELPKTATGKIQRFKLRA